MATFKEVASTFPINAPVEWYSSSRDVVCYGVVTGYQLNSLDEIVVEVKPVTNPAKPYPTALLHPQNSITRLTHAVNGDRLW